MATLAERLPKDELERLIAAGKTQIEVSEMYDVCQASIRLLAQKCGLYFPPRQKGPEPKNLVAPKISYEPSRFITVASPAPQKKDSLPTSDEIKRLQQKDLQTALWEIRKRIRQLGLLEAAIFKETEYRQNRMEDAR